MKIVVLDGYTLNPGDLSWSGLQALGEVVIYDRTSSEELMERAQGAEVLLTNETILYADSLSQLSALKYIGVLATGYNVVDVKVATTLGIVVTNIPTYGTYSVAQTVFAHLLAITQRVEHYAQESRQLCWSNSIDFSYWNTPLIELANKKMGLVGLGNIGWATAQIALAFGMKVLAYTSKEQKDLPPTIEKVTLDELFTQSDVVSLHCPLTSSTDRLVSANRLEQMKPTAILINTGRGLLIDEAALAAALNSGKIYAAGLDVLSKEPPAPDNPLLSAKNCFVTPHMAWATKEARSRLMEMAIMNLQTFLSGGEIKNRVGID
ncbi:MAG: D-2-hydroxyacid dehydrogenase [Phocaeicola sp.]